MSDEFTVTLSDDDDCISTEPMSLHEAVTTAEMLLKAYSDFIVTISKKEP